MIDGAASPLLRHIAPQMGKLQICLSLRVLGNEQGPALAFSRLFPARFDLFGDLRLQHFNATNGWRDCSRRSCPLAPI
jgi:hypothetical protein